MRSKKPTRKPDPRGYGITVSTYIQPDVYKRLVAVANADRRTTSNVIEFMIEQALPDYEARMARK